MASKNPYGLNDKQFFFCLVYWADPEKNATQAYLRIYRPKNIKVAEACSSRLLSNAKIQSFLDTLRQQDMKEAKVDRQYVLEKLQRMADVGLEEKVKKDEDGNVTSRRFNDSYTGSKGVELLGKHFKMFTDRVEHSGEVKLTGVLKLDHPQVTLQQWITGAGATVVDERETNNKGEKG